jgi:hypothetical protein
MFTLSTIQSAVLDKIAERWPYKPTTTHASAMFKPFAEAITKESKALLGASAFGSITGGAAPSFGPVVGAMCTYAAGGLTVQPVKLFDSFKYATFTLERPNVPTFTTSTPTLWMKKFVGILLPLYDEAYNDWFKQWTGTTDAFGGSAGWTPGSPPLPGPWVGGSVNRLKLSNGTSSSTKMLQLADTFISKLKASSITIPIDGDDITVSMCANEHCENMARSISGGMSDAFFDMVQNIEVFDKTSSAGSGTAAPGGIITGSITCTLDVGG